MPLLERVVIGWWFIVVEDKGGSGRVMVKSSTGGREGFAIFVKIAGEENVGDVKTKDIRCGEWLEGWYDPSMEGWFVECK